MSKQRGRTFAEASKAIQDNLSRHISKYEEMLNNEASSSEEDDEKQDDLLEKTLQHYGSGDTELVASTREFLRSALQSASCLICIESIKKTDRLWNCRTCYVSLHLSCTQKWAKDSIFQLKQQLEDDDAGNRSPVLFWSCPKCRAEYSPQQVPTQYLCFCRKEVEPRFDPWLKAHSCGEKCGKPLIPECKHKCLLLCHPGP